MPNTISTDQKLDEIIDIVSNLTVMVGQNSDKITDLQHDVNSLKLDVGGLKQDVNGLKQDVGGLKQDVGGLKQDVSVIGKKLDNLTDKFLLHEVTANKRFRRLETFHNVIHD